MGEKSYIIRCTADAVVSERWRVKASSIEEALDRFDDNHESLEFEEHIGWGGEENRRDIEVEEAEPLPEGFDREKLRDWLVSDMVYSCQSDKDFLRSVIQDFWRDKSDEDLVQAFNDATTEDAKLPT